MSRTCGSPRIVEGVIQLNRPRFPAAPIRVRTATCSGPGVAAVVVVALQLIVTSVADAYDDQIDIVTA
jgi:hypothetical protein